MERGIAVQIEKVAAQLRHFVSARQAGGTGSVEEPQQGPIGGQGTLSSHTLSDKEGASSVVGRRLCHVERGYWKFNQASPINVTVSARIKGPLPETALREALSALQARHPYLRAGIEVDASGQPSFRFSSVGPIPLRVVHRSQDDWVHELERELNDRFRCGEGPLTRCVLLRHGHDDMTVILTVQHTICDGEGMRYAMRDLLEAAGRAALGLSPDLLPLTDTLSVEERLPGRLWSMHGLRLMTEFLFEEVRLFAKHGAPFKVPRDRDVPVHARQFRCTHKGLDETQTAKLLLRAKEERTTVHGALSSAMILGALHDSDVMRSVRVALVSPVNLRASLVPPVGHDTGYYVSLIPYRAAVHPDVSFWDLARSVRDQMASGLSRGDAPMMMDLLDGIFHLLQGPSAKPLEIAERWEKAVAGSMLLSNLGRQDFEFDSGPLSVDALYVCSSLSCFGDFGAVAHTFRDRLIWTFVWADPLIGPQRAERLTSAIINRLEQALSD